MPTSTPRVPRNSGEEHQQLLAGVQRRLQLPDLVATGAPPPSPARSFRSRSRSPPLAADSEPKARHSLLAWLTDVAGIEAAAAAAYASALPAGGVATVSDVKAASTDELRACGVVANGHLRKISLAAGGAAAGLAGEAVGATEAEPVPAPAPGKNVGIGRGGHGRELPKSPRAAHRPVPRAMQRSPAAAPILPPRESRPEGEPPPPTAFADAAGPPSPFARDPASPVARDHAGGSTEVAAATITGGAEAAAMEVGFSVGARVVISGLVSHQEYNDQTGVVVGGLDPKTDSYGERLDAAGAEVNLRPANLTAATGGGAAAAEAAAAVASVTASAAEVKALREQVRPALQTVAALPRARVCVRARVVPV